MTAPLHILHVFSTFGPGGPQVRTCDLMNRLGPEFSHTVVAVDGNMQAATRIRPHVACRQAPAPSGKGSLFYPIAFHQLLHRTRPALLVTYNWGAFDAVIAASAASVCPVLHAEDGFGPDEATRLKRRRVWIRRAFLNRLRGVVVPSRTLLDIAVSQYKVRPDTVRWIPNGVDISRFRPGRCADLRKSWRVANDTVLFGYTGRLAGEKNLELLIRAFAAAGPLKTKLVLIGQGPARPVLEDLARNLGIGERVIFAGLLEDMTCSYGALDVFVMSSITEQMPLSLVEAMACGLPAVCTDVGDCAETLGIREAPAIVPSRDVFAYTESIRAFARNERLRSEFGARNRARAVAKYSFDDMVSAYAGLYTWAARQL